MTSFLPERRALFVFKSLWERRSLVFYGFNFRMKRDPPFNQIFLFQFQFIAAGHWTKFVLVYYTFILKRDPLHHSEDTWAQKILPGHQNHTWAPKSYMCTKIIHVYQKNTCVPKSYMDTKIIHVYQNHTWATKSYMSFGEKKGFSLEIHVSYMGLKVVSAPMPTNNNNRDHSMTCRPTAAGKKN